MPLKIVALKNNNKHQQNNNKNNKRATNKNIILLFVLLLVLVLTTHLNSLCQLPIVTFARGSVDLLSNESFFQPTTTYKIPLLPGVIRSDFVVKIINSKLVNKVIIPA